MTVRIFPFLMSEGGVPWRMLSDHEAWALANYGAPLEDLGRYGLLPTSVLAILTEVSPNKVDPYLGRTNGMDPGEYRSHPKPEGPAGDAILKLVEAWGDGRGGEQFFPVKPTIADGKLLGPALVPFAALERRRPQASMNQNLPMASVWEDLADQGGLNWFEFTAAMNNQALACFLADLHVKSTSRRMTDMFWATVDTWRCH